MSVLSREDYEFLEIQLGGDVPMPPNPIEVITPEAEDPYWEISYENGLAIFASGNVIVKTQLKEAPQVLEGGKSRRKAAISIDRVKENTGDVI